MVRALRKKRLQTPHKKEQYDSDDPEAYKGMPVPDKKSSQYTKDTIDEFHDEKISKLLARGVKMNSDNEDIDEEEEVMVLEMADSEDDDEDSEEESDMESDLEGKKNDDLPNELAWGNRKKIFYDSDYVAAKGKTQEEVEAEEAEEEEEAKNIQRRLVSNLSEEDYDLNLLQEFAVEEKEEEQQSVDKKERIVKDLKMMSQKEKMKLLRKESPELLELIQDFKSKLAELKDELQPLLEMVKDGRIPTGKGANYLKTKQQLYLNYCTNISFYLVLKAKRIPAHNHPVIERLVTYRNLINELGAVDARLAPQLRLLLAEQRREKPTKKTVSSKESKKTKVSEEADPVAAEESDSSLDEEAALLFYRGVEERLNLKRKTKDPQAEEGLAEGVEEEAAAADTDAKRGITYQMAKNKGLTPKRKKIDRNPRVKHREKFRRAKIRRKGQVREVRREESRYSGELSGIRAGVKKSVKLQ